MKQRSSQKTAYQNAGKFSQKGSGAILQNDFLTNTQKSERTLFSRRARIILDLSIVSTGLYSIAGILGLIRGILERRWEAIGITAFAWKQLYLLIILCSFLSLLKIALDERPFSRILCRCLWLIGGIFAAASVVFPRFPDYRSSGFELFSHDSFVLVDGMFLMTGFLFVVLGCLISAGVRMQAELDATL